MAGLRLNQAARMERDRVVGEALARLGPWEWWEADMVRRQLPDELGRAMSTVGLGRVLAGMAARGEVRREWFGYMWRYKPNGAER